MVDLHTHSFFSDGEASPEELALQAVRRNAVIALTDHNTVKGLPSFLDAGGYSEKLVAGIEFSTAVDGCSFHILGLFIDEKHFDETERLASVFLKNKRESNILLAENLKNAGFDVSYTEVEALCPEGNVNRAAFAELLMNKGYISDIEEGIKGILSKERGYYIPPAKPDSRDVTEFLRGINAVPVLAHPLCNHPFDKLLTIVPLLKKAGLAGIETIHSQYDPEQTAQAERLREKFSLLASGGSDFHGRRKPGISLFTGKGNLSVPDEYFINLREFNLKQRKGLI